MTFYFADSTLRQISKDLRKHAHTDPPTYLEVCRARGFDAAAHVADSLNRWNAAGQHGHFTDPEYQDGRAEP